MALRGIYKKTGIVDNPVLTMFQRTEKLREGVLIALASSAM